MDFSNTLSILATVASLLITGIGFPVQIYKNYKNKDTFGVSYILFILSFVSYLLWSMRAYTVGDWYMFVAYVPGVLLSIVILFQISYYRNHKIMKLLNDSVRIGVLRFSIFDNPDIKKFLTRVPIEKAIYWAGEIDDQTDIWNLVLSRKDVTLKIALKCAETQYNTIVWDIVLKRVDVQNYLFGLSAAEAITYAEKSEKGAVWEFILTRKDVQDLLMNMHRSHKELMNYVDKYNNIHELRSFVLSKSYPKSEGFFTDQQHM